MDTKEYLTKIARICKKYEKKLHGYRLSFKKLYMRCTDRAGKNRRSNKNCGRNRFEQTLSFWLLCKVRI